MPENMDDIINKIRNNNSEENRKLAEDMKNKLSPEQKNALDKIISDKSMMQKILENEKVQQIIRKIGGESNGHK